MKKGRKLGRSLRTHYSPLTRMRTMWRYVIWPVWYLWLVTVHIMWRIMQTAFHFETFYICQLLPNMRDRFNNSFHIQLKYSNLKRSLPPRGSFFKSLPIPWQFLRNTVTPPCATTSRSANTCHKRPPIQHTKIFAVVGTSLSLDSWRGCLRIYFDFYFLYFDYFPD